MIYTSPNAVKLTIREPNNDFKVLAAAAEPRRPAAADGHPFGGAAVSLLATVCNSKLTL